MKKDLLQAWINIRKHSLAAFAIICIMVLTLFISSIAYLMSSNASDILVSVVQNIPITAELSDKFNKDTFDELVAELTNRKFAQSDKIHFISKEEALRQFQKQYADKKELLAFIDQTTNPLYSSITIIPTQTSQRSKIIQILKSPKYSTNLITDIKESTSTQSQKKFTQFLASLQKARSLIIRLALTLAIIAIIIIYQSQQLVFLHRKEELKIIKIIGAPLAKIKNPLLLESIFYGIVSAVIAFVLTWIFIYQSQPLLSKLLGDLSTDIVSSLHISLPIIALLQLISANLLALSSTYLAISKHLKT